ncbi:hypothetical protein RO3G_05055 [Rhizopus delemar RA 99-880]|uniref:Uncharacterized protein n=1 Tax=Rhizopus delemar (strain RA 99-880 / ATCC MYA-4621 / FGSC 9543 / NRRL 43880) TaxID=246409 RepID=I1BVX0_RHIO9|nr:hypothetical protein RO3G_05055 [Rhizopus delemar RA 99-880]|eukprot:EIE80350.1 hypothetical protein RO3G_05055 [Rhizopus delemar RA 99-880]
MRKNQSRHNLGREELEQDSLVRWISLCHFGNDGFRRVPRMKGERLLLQHIIPISRYAAYAFCRTAL